MVQPLIRAAEISFQYENALSPALKRVSLEIKSGEFTAILGANGSGKSTLARMLNGLLLPTEGMVYIGSMSTADATYDHLIKQTVGMVFQNPDNQIVSTIVEEDIAFALENLAFASEEIRDRVDEALKMVDMYAYRLHSPYKLSGGQKQRVAIASMIALRPKCIILDESTAMLDPEGRQLIMDTLQFLNANYQISVVFITHSMEEAALAKRVVVLHQGEVLVDETPELLFNRRDLLAEWKLTLPGAVQLRNVLQESGIPISNDVLTEAQLIKALAQWMEEEDGPHNN